MKARSRKLLDRAVAALVAAIDVYNKFNFRYRAESFIIVARFGTRSCESKTPKPNRN